VVPITITAADTFCSSAAFRTQDSSASDWAADHCGLTDLTAMADEDAGDGAGLAGGDVEREEVDKFECHGLQFFVQDLDQCEQARSHDWPDEDAPQAHDMKCADDADEGQ